MIVRQFGDLLRALHAELLEQEKKEKLSGISSDSPEFLQIYTELVRKSQTLGIQPGKFNF